MENNKINSKGKLLYSLLFLAVLLVGLAVGIRLSQQQQRPAPSAMVSEGTAILSFTGNSNVDPGSELQVDVNVYAPETVSDSTSDGITAVRAEVTYDNTLVNLPMDKITTNLSGWVYPVVETSVNGNMTTLNINGVYFASGQDGYTGAAQNPQKFASLRFDTLRSGSSTLSWGSNSQVLAKETNIQALNSNIQSFSFNVGSAATPTTEPGDPTPTTIQGQPSNTPNPTAVPTSGPGPTNSCGGTCGSNANCNTGLTCFAGFCRNPACSTVTNCSCPGPTNPPAATNTPNPTNYPTSAPQATPTTQVFDYSEPTIASENPFLTGEARLDEEQNQEIVPEIAYETESLDTSETWWEALIRIVTEFFQVLFGFR